MPKGWGRLTRKGAGRMGDEEATTKASEEWRAAMRSSKAAPKSRMRPIPQRPGEKPRPPAPAEGEARSGGTPGEPKPKEAWEPELWILEDDGSLEQEATRAVARGRGRGGEGSRGAPSGARGRDEDIEASVRAELARATGAPPGSNTTAKLEIRLRDATRAFEAERFTDAARILRKLAEQTPSAASVRELYGLTLYRQGKWRAAAHELEAFRLLTDSTEQNPVLADCYRALHRYQRVEELWEELRESSPGAELVTEGRIVAAGARADQGDVRGAIKLLEQGFSIPKRAKEHHLRRMYALGDTYERAGDLVRAREMFRSLQRFDPDFADVGQRVRALR